MKLTTLQIETIKSELSNEVRQFMNYGENKTQVYIELGNIDADLEYQLVTPQIINGGLTLLAELQNCEIFDANGDSLKVSNEEEITRVFIKCW